MKEVSLKTLGYRLVDFLVGFLGGAAMVLILLGGATFLLMFFSFLEETGAVHLNDWQGWTLIFMLCLGAVAVPGVIFAGLLLTDPVQSNRWAYFGVLTAVGISLLVVAFILVNGLLGD